MAIVEICCKTFQPRPGSPLLRQGQSVRDLSRGQVFFIQVYTLRIHVHPKQGIGALKILLKKESVREFIGIE